MRNSQLEILAQAQQYLQSVIKTDYTEIPVPNFMSSAGSHIRHIVDHYSAIMAGIESDIIDYDVRTRGSQIEECPEIAVKKVSDISNWILRKVRFASIPRFEISSSTIRSRWQENKTIRYMVTQPVWEYINDHGIYK